MRSQFEICYGSASQAGVRSRSRLNFNRERLRLANNPNGIESFSPGLASPRATLGYAVYYNNPESGCIEPSPYGEAFTLPASWKNHRLE
jgi:hypothetical protein